MKFRELLAVWIAGREFEGPVIVQSPPKPRLIPGTCECDHKRCIHVEGIGKCTVQYWKDANGKPLPEEERGVCACKIYIKEKDDDDDEEEETPPPDPEVAELERMMK